MNFKHQVIPIWMICYDGEANRIYSFTDFEKAIASVESSIRGYFGDEGPEFDQVCDQVTSKMRELRNSACIPMRFNNLDVIIYNWELDSANPIHKMLVECYDLMNDDAKKRITNLFVESKFNYPIN